MKINIAPFLRFFENISVLKLFFVVVIFPTAMVLVTILTNHRNGTDYRVTHEVFFDIEIAGEYKGQIVIGLFGETTPKTVQNFYTLATTGVDGYKYEGTTFHRVIKRFMIQGGDVTHGEGVGRYSIYGETFPDENFDVKHVTLGFVAMANSGPDSNACQFYITTTGTTWLDGKHVVFGKVIEGQGYVHLIEHLGTDYNDKPVQEVKIAKSGSRNVRYTYTVSDDPYNIYDWLRTISIPLSLSFGIILVFHYFIKQIDKGIETEEALSELKNKHLARVKRGSIDVDGRFLRGKNKGRLDREGLRKRGGAQDDSAEDTDEEKFEDELTKKIQDHKQSKGSQDPSKSALPKEVVDICKTKTN